MSAEKSSSNMSKCRISAVRPEALEGRSREGIRRSCFDRLSTNGSDKNSKCGGFTFVEILLTMVIIAVSAAPLMQLFATAVEQTGTVDEIRTALDLSREEIEKVKNLALTEEQIKSLGNVVSPPIFLNRTVWFAVRVVDPEASPMKITVFIFRDSLATRPVVSLVTILSK